MVELAADVVAVLDARIAELKGLREKFVAAANQEVMAFNVRIDELERLAHPAAKMDQLSAAPGQGIMPTAEGGDG